MRYTSAKSRPTYTFDANLELKDAGLVAADAAAQVNSADKIIDLGSGFVQGDLVIDVTAIEVASDNERYDIVLQLSNSATFASGIFDKCILALGANEVIAGDADSETGRYTLPFNNRGVDEDVYRYARLYTDVSGTIATGINYSAFLALHQ